jgi:ribosomal-protein-alanine N-acetyltransferase
VSEFARIDLPEGRFIDLLRESDVNQTYIDALNDRNRVQHMVSVKEKMSYDDAVRYVRENLNKVDTFLFGIFEQEILLGTSRLHDIDRHNGTAHIGIFIFPHDPPKKGLGTSVIKTITDYAFSELGLHTIHAGIFIDNTASIRAFTKAGFNVHDHSEYQGRHYQKWIKQRAF